ncbi:hypothetical protein BDD12DRAFT_806036 [Trichophaea hybrida]|nr:hypothetical protein BDD12DRAFT_806036 [Trichophaea hybrida]
MGPTSLDNSDHLWYSSTAPKHKARRLDDSQTTPDGIRKRIHKRHRSNVKNEGPYRENRKRTDRKTNGMVGQPTIHREGRSVISDPFKFEGTQPEVFEPWENAVREKIKGDGPAYFTNTETVWGYLCGRTSGKVLIYMRARNMTQYLPGPNEMLYKGAEIEYVLEEFLKTVEKNFADTIQKVEWVNQ